MSIHRVNRRGARRFASRCILLAAAVPVWVHGQSSAVPEAAPGRTFSIVPTFSLTETFTDNRHLTTNNRQSDLITQVSPGLHMTSSGGRVRGFFDYSLTGLLYARDSDSNEFQNSLNAALNVEAVENFAYVDIASTISQQFVSAFGTRSTDPSLVNRNLTETRTLRVSPYLRGTLASSADYEARLTHDSTKESGASAVDETTNELSLRVAQRTTATVFSWSAEGVHRNTDFGLGRDTEEDVVRGVLGFAPNPDLRLSARAGYESNNFVSLDKKGHSIWGLGVDWIPSERTKLSAFAEERYFGPGHSLTFAHRSARTVFTFSDVRDVFNESDRRSPGSLGTAYDLFFSLFASQQPDPVLRGQLVEAFLLANGIPRSATVPTGLAVSTETVERRQQLSLALLGLRDTVVLSAWQTRTQRLAGAILANANDDLANGNQLRERSVDVNWAHRLTPQAALNVTLSISRNSGTVLDQSTDLRTLYVSWTGRLGPRSSLSIGARRAEFRSPIEPYDESAVIVSLSFQL